MVVSLNLISRYYMVDFKKTKTNEKGFSDGPL